jgi:hypothetical protein
MMWMGKLMVQGEKKKVLIKEESERCNPGDGDIHTSGRKNLTRFAMPAVVARLGIQ